MVNNKPTKILIISEVFFPEEFLINDLAYYWKGQGHFVSVLTRNPSYPNGQIYKGYKNHLFQKEVIEEIPVYRVQFIPGYKKNDFIKTLNYLWNMVLGIIWAVKNGTKFDSIYIYQTGPLTFSSIGIVIKKLYKKRVTIWSQDVWPDTVYAYGLGKTKLSKFCLEKFVKWVYSNIDHITISCPGFESVLQKYCPEKIIYFIPQWSSTVKLKSLQTEDSYKQIELPGTFNFLFAGNIGKVQNLENVILGFDKFLKEKKLFQTWLNIFGDGSNLPLLKTLVIDKRIENVRFWGRVPSKEMPSYYQKANVLIISLDNKPIFNLTIPAKFQSYLNAEKPIFGIINGEVSTLITKHNLGWIADPESIESISKEYHNIVTSEATLFEEKTKNAHILLNESFNREKLIKKITSLVLDAKI
jgi:glycosyltransferase involved in cell wall biosynthesis